MPNIAWYADMELPPHFLAFAKGGPLDVVVTWGAPIPFGHDSDRKRATAEAEAEVRRARG
jgi:1-acyl-sn-glycerol-3-phosphate acyltransferase